MGSEMCIRDRYDTGTTTPYPSGRTYKDNCFSLDNNMTTRRSSHCQPGWYMPYAVSATNPKPINRSSSSTAVHARIYHTWYGTYARMYSVCSIPGTRYHGTRQDACKNKINKMLEEYTDAPSIRDTPSILGAYAILRVYSEYRVFFVLRVLRVLEYWQHKYSECLEYEQY